MQLWTLKVQELGQVLGQALVPFEAEIDEKEQTGLQGLSWVRLCSLMAQEQVQEQVPSEEEICEREQIQLKELLLARPLPLTGLELALVLAQVPSAEGIAEMER